MSDPQKSCHLVRPCWTTRDWSTRLQQVRQLLCLTPRGRLT